MDASAKRTAKISQPKTKTLRAPARKDKSKNIQNRPITKNTSNQIKNPKKHLKLTNTKKNGQQYLISTRLNKTITATKKEEGESSETARPRPYPNNIMG